MKVEDLGEFKFQLDRIARYTNSGYQFWNARELQTVLQYSSWQRFESVIQRAMISCLSSGYNPTDHFNTGVKMVSLGSGSTREVTDYKISKYGCYLVAMNGDPAQKEIRTSIDDINAMIYHRNVLNDLRKLVHTLCIK